jgi:C-terminal processing protease CtpA/Prc
LPRSTARLDGLTPDEARDRIRGEKGTTVVLRIEREGVDPFDVSITRDTIHQREVITDDYADGDVGYVRLTSFSENGASVSSTRWTRPSTRARRGSSSTSRQPAAS